MQPGFNKIKIQELIFCQRFGAVLWLSSTSCYAQCFQMKLESVKSPFYLNKPIKNFGTGTNFIWHLFLDIRIQRTRKTNKAWKVMFSKVQTFLRTFMYKWKLKNYEWMHWSLSGRRSLLSVSSSNIYNFLSINVFPLLFRIINFIDL